jgi:hypothetical protein
VISTPQYNAFPFVFIQPREAALDHTTFWNDFEGMQLASLGDLHRYVLA